MDTEHEQKIYNGEKNYNNSFIKRTSSMKNKFKTHCGNIRSITASRNKSNKSVIANRISDYNMNHLIKKYHVIDNIITKKPYGSYRKNYLDTIITNRSYNKINQQKINFIDLWKTDTDTDSDEKIINLPEIHPNLYIGNLSSCNNITIGKNRIGIIINLNDVMKNSNYKIYNILYKYTKNLNIKIFRSVIASAFKIMDNEFHNNTNVLIICNKGVNRSVSIAVAYAILRKGFKFNTAISYIDEIKLNKYPTWNSLTNTRIRNLLKSLNS